MKALEVFFCEAARSHRFDCLWSVAGAIVWSRRADCSTPWPDTLWRQLPQSLCRHTNANFSKTARAEMCKLGLLKIGILCRRRILAKCHRFAPACDRWNIDVTHQASSEELCHLLLLLLWILIIDLGTHAAKEWKTFLAPSREILRWTQSERAKSAHCLPFLTWCSKSALLNY